MRKSNKKNRGFTMIEFMVAGAVFVTIMMAITSIFVRSLRAYSQMVANQEVQDEIRYAVDTISRAVRVSEIVSGGASLSIQNHPTKGNITYTLNGGVLEENGIGITSSKVDIESLSFTVSGIGFEGFGIGVQPRVTINIKAKSANPVFAAQTELYIQTTISQKVLDVDLSGMLVVFLSTIDFILEGNYIEEDAVAGTDIGGGVTTLHEEVWAWTQRDVDMGALEQTIRSIIYDAVNNKYVAGGYDEASGQMDAVIWESSDLITWTQRDVDMGASSQYTSSIIYDAVNNKYIAGGADAANGDADAVIWESADLISWTQRDVDMGANIQIIDSIIYDAVNNKYVAGGYDTVSGSEDAVIWESSDLISWTQRNIDIGANIQRVMSIIYDVVNNKYIAGGFDVTSGDADAVIWESSDLITWTQRDVDMGASSQYIRSIIYDAINNKYVAGGDDATDAVIWESSDLISWTQRDVDMEVNSQRINSIIYDTVNNKYIAGGADAANGDADAVIWESADLINWTQRDVDMGGDVQRIRSIIYDAVNNKYVSGGDDSASGNYDAVVWESAFNSTYPIAQAYYVTTADSIQIDTSIWTAITGVITSEATPGTTSIKYLVSFDGRASWKYWDGDSWEVSTIDNLQTNGMTKIEIEAIIEAEWESAGGFVAGTTLTLNFAADLKTTNASVTPLLDGITVNYEL